MLQTEVVDRTKKCFLCSITFFLFKNRAVYEIMCKNMVQPMTDDKMAHAHYMLDT